MYEIKVDGNETTIVPVENPEISLTTSGVSTCICLLVKGRVGTMQYIGMHHWDGFSDVFNRNAPDAAARAKELIDDLFFVLADEVLTEMEPYNDDQDEKPGLDALYLIGGEHSIEGDLTGTELEVETLRHHAEAICADYFITSESTVFFRDHYRTSINDSLKVIFSVSKVDIIFEEDCSNSPRFQR